VKGYVLEVQKQVIFPGTVSIIIFSLLFFILRNSYQEQYESTQKEIASIKNIAIYHSVKMMMKHNITLNQQSENNTTPELAGTIPCSEILHKLKQINNQAFMDNFSNLVDQKKYDLLLKIIDDKIYDISSTLLDPQRDIAFLVDIIVHTLPEAQKNLQNLRSVKFDDEVFKFQRLVLQSNLKMLLQHIDKVIQTSTKIKTTDPKLRELIESIKIDFELLEYNFLDLNTIKNPKNIAHYFSKLDEIENLLNDLFIRTKELLILKLQKRETDIGQKLYYGSGVYIFIILLTLLMMQRNFYKSKKLLKIVDKKKQEDIYLFKLKEDLSKVSSLKNVCEFAIKSLVKEFSAVSGRLYIYDDHNYKLYLGGSAGLTPKDIDTTLAIHDNLIGDCIIDHQFKITHTNILLDDGIEKITISERVSIPLVSLDKSIGAVELYFRECFDYCEMEFLKKVIYIVTNSIYQTERDNQTAHYLKLIDKNIMVIKTDLNGDIIDVSEEFCNLTGYTKRELVGNNNRIFRHEETPHSLYVELWAKLRKGLVWRGEIKNKTKDGNYYWADNIIAPNFDLNGNIIGYTGIKHDITSKKLVEKLSITDPLTGIYNRRYFEKIFDKQLLIAQRESSKLALAIIDIDYFKQYNDTYGHPEGDKTLIAVAKTIESLMYRPNDYCFRIGGEEFAVLYMYKTKENALIFSNKIRKHVQNLHIEHSGHYSSRYVTISVGLTLIEGKTFKNTDIYFREADDALYKAKNDGRNRVVVYQ